MTPSIIKYPYDPTGQAETNFIAGELHSIPILKNRAFALEAGPFYSESVVLRSLPTNQLLTRGVDYETLYVYQEATRKTGKAVVAVIFVTNSNISGQLSVDYQVVGGEFSSNVAAIQLLIESLEIDNRAIVWDDIIDKPVTFPPAPHLHDVGDLYGMEALVSAINDLKAAIEGNEGAAYQQLADRISALENTALGHSNDIAGLWAEIERINTAILNLSGRVDQDRLDIDEIKSNDLFIPTPSGANLVGGKKYLLTSEGDSKLPTTVGLEVGTEIKVRRLGFVIPTYSVWNNGSERIRYIESRDVSVRHSTKTELSFVYVGSGLWECTK